MNKVIKYICNMFLPVLIMNLLAYCDARITDYVKTMYRFFLGRFVFWPFAWAAICTIVLLLLVVWNRKEPSIGNGISLIAGIALLLLPAIGYVTGTGFFNRIMPYFTRSINTVSMPIAGMFTFVYVYLIRINFSRR